MTKLYEKMRLAENIKGQRYLRGINHKIELIIKLMEAETVKIYEVEYTKQAKVNGTRGWADIRSESIKVEAPTVERAIAAARKHALTPYPFKDESGEKQIEKYRDFELVSVDLVAEADIKG
jgi:hypothetical protein